MSGNIDVTDTVLLVLQSKLLEVTRERDSLREQLIKLLDYILLIDSRRATRDSLAKGAVGRLTSKEPNLEVKDDREKG